MKQTIAAVLALASLGPVFLGVCARPAAADPAPAQTKARPDRAQSAVFSGDYKETSARDVILDIARAARLNAVIPSDLEGNVTAHLQDVPVMRALALVVGLTNADYRVMDDTIYIIKRTVIVRPARAASEPSGDMAESEVERIAGQIDAQDRPAQDRPARRARADRPVSPSVRVETYINIQSAPPVPFARPVAPLAPSFGWPGYNNVYPPYDPLGGVYHVQWDPSGITRIPGGNIYPRGSFYPAWRY